MRKATGVELAAMSRSERRSRRRKRIESARYQRNTLKRYRREQEQ